MKEMVLWVIAGLLFLAACVATWIEQERADQNPDEYRYKPDDTGTRDA